MRGIAAANQHSYCCNGCLEPRSSLKRLQIAPCIFTAHASRLQPARSIGLFSQRVRTFQRHAKGQQEADRHWTSWTWGAYMKQLFYIFILFHQTLVAKENIDTHRYTLNIHFWCSLCKDSCRNSRAVMWALFNRSTFDAMRTWGQVRVATDVMPAAASVPNQGMFSPISFLIFFSSFLSHFPPRIGPSVSTI